MKDRVPLYPGRVKLTPVSGQENTYDMVRSDEPTQEGTPLSKATFLKDATAALFGMTESAVPDDVLAFLGQYAQHWWSVLHGQASIAYEEKRTIGTNTQLLYCHDYANGSVTIQYADKISIDQTNGKISLVNPSTVQFTANLSTSVRATRLKQLYGKYATGIPELADTSTASSTDVSSKVFYIVDGASYFAPSDSNNAGFNPQGFYTVTSQIVNVPAGETTYEYSTDRNAYPDSGTVDGLTYQYLGVPFQKLPTMPQVATGSYAGTGTYGSSNPNSLTFGFEPKYLFIAAAYDTSGNKCGLFSSSTFVDCISCEILTTSYVKGKGFSPDSSHPCFAKKSSDGKTISWYSDYADNRQYNEANYTYYYMAIG